MPAASNQAQAKQQDGPVTQVHTTPAKAPPQEGPATHKHSNSFPAPAVAAAAAPSAVHGGEDVGSKAKEKPSKAHRGSHEHHAPPSPGASKLGAGKLRWGFKDGLGHQGEMRFRPLRAHVCMPVHDFRLKFQTRVGCREAEGALTPFSHESNSLTMIPNYQDPKNFLRPQQSALLTSIPPARAEQVV